MSDSPTTFQYNSTNQPPPTHGNQGSVGPLPFSGLDLTILALAGVALLGSGALMRRLSR